jgi:opacity protein-like surface antigen
MKKILFLLAVAAVVMLSTAQAQAVTLGFNWIEEIGDTPQKILDGSYGEAQLRMKVLAPDGTNVLAGQVGFEFFLVAAPAPLGFQAMSITDIYFDDGTLLGMVTPIAGSSGTGYSQNATPVDLPAGNTLTPPFVTSVDPIDNSLKFSADSSNPAQGVNQVGEWVRIVFNLQSGKDFDDTIAALADGSLRVGLHITAYASNGSEAFVNNPVPLPGAMLLFGAGMARLVAYARRRQDS